MVGSCVYRGAHFDRWPRSHGPARRICRQSAPSTACQKSQDDLAFEAEVGRSYLSQIQNRVFFASLKIIGRLAAALDVEAAELLRLPPKRGKQADGHGHARCRSSESGTYRFLLWVGLLPSTTPRAFAAFMRPACAAHQRPLLLGKRRVPMQQEPICIAAELFVPSSVATTTTVTDSRRTQPAPCPLLPSALPSASTRRARASSRRARQREDPTAKRSARQPADKPWTRERRLEFGIRSSVSKNHWRPERAGTDMFWIEQQRPTSHEAQGEVELDHCRCSRIAASLVLKRAAVGPSNETD
jgi:hypothetical protein